jgi:hypothetical protein
MPKQLLPFLVSFKEQEKFQGSQGYSSVAECLLSMHKALDSILSTEKRRKILRYKTDN